MTIATTRPLKLVQRFTMPDSVEAINVFYFETDFTTPQAESTVISQLEDWIEDLYGTLTTAITSDTTLGTFTLYEWDTLNTQWDSVGEGSPSVSFAATGNMLPHGVAALVRAYSENSRSIGRKYIPGMSDQTQVDGDWTAATLTALAAFGNMWDNTPSWGTAESLIPSVWSRFYMDMRHLSGVEVILAQPAYQRRRRPGVGS